MLHERIFLDPENPEVYVDTYIADNRKAFKDNGDIVIMTARNIDKLEAARKEVGGDLAFSMDVTKSEEWDKIVEIIKKKYDITTHSLMSAFDAGRRSCETGMIETAEDPFQF